MREDQSGDNVFMNSARNKDKKIVEIVINTAKDLLDNDDIKNFCIEHCNFITDSLGIFALVAQDESFEMFWSFLEKKITNEKLMDVFLQRDRNGNNVLMNSSGNKNTLTIKLIIEKAKKILTSTHCMDAVELKDKNWLVDATCQYAFLAESEAFQVFWTWLSENLDKKNQKRVLLQKSRNASNFLVSSLRNKEKMGVETVFNVAKRSVGFEESLWILNSESNNRLVDIARHFGYLGESEGFTTIKSILHENFAEDDTNLVPLQKNKTGINALMSSAENKDIKTVKLFIETAASLLDAHDIDEALNSEYENWVLEALGAYVLLADFEAFALFWKFLCGKISPNNRKIVLFKKKTNGISAIMASAENKDISTIKFIIEAAKSLLDDGDFKVVSTSREQNWMVDTLGRYSLLSEPDAFEMFWKFLKEKLDKDDLKAVLLQKTQHGRNAFSASARNKILPTVHLVLKTAEEVITSEDFKKSVIFGSESWLVDTLSQYAFRSEWECFEMLWAIVQKNLIET